MSTLQERLRALSPKRLAGIRRGIEKESLRALGGGSLALTPHPPGLGSALTHPHITTDFSESQLEFVTGAFDDVEACLGELTRIHQFTLRAIGDEMLWASSMPCHLPADETIPIGRYGGSNVGRAKSVYRMGLGHRYGRRMQTISGIHYNWSLPELTNEEYFGLIRNFRRHSFLLLLLFGASPAVGAGFAAGREHRLQPLGEDSLYLPHATSLRMGRLGYQSDAQASLCVSYNCLEQYAQSLHDALTRPYGPYEAVGVRNPGGEYNQLGTTLLQIENEFYGSIRPKRVIFSGERPLHALRERGVEYVEVRCMDLDPFEPVGISAATARVLDVFLLHCLLSPSPPDTPAEIAALARNQDRVASRGREPGLTLERGTREVPIADWAAELLEHCAPIAAALDAARPASLRVAHGSGDSRGDLGPWTAALEAARASLGAPATLPSSRVLAEMTREFGGSHVAFVSARSRRIRDGLLALPFDAQAEQHLRALAQVSIDEQQRLEAADSLPFEAYREAYLAPERLAPRRRRVAPPVT